jgi:hypothetical protein
MVFFQIHNPQLEDSDQPDDEESNNLEEQEMRHME